MATPRVCIVDDNLIARETIADLLYPENYKLQLLESGIQLLSRIHELTPDVILLDVMMPELNGFEVCQQLKNNPKWQHTPIVLITALDSKDSLVRGLDAGADEFLAKPVNGSELRARVRSMLRIKKQYDELHATLQLREDMANMLVHDMRTPLATIALYCGLIRRRNNLLAKDQEGFRAIQNEVRTLESFVNDMLMLAKMERGKLLLNLALQSIHGLVFRLKEQYQVLAELNDIKIVVELPEEERQFLIDETLFKRMLDNLLSNALKFSPAHSTITLRICYLDNLGKRPTYRIQVIDEGAGIPPHERQNIFDKFKIISLKQKGLPQIGLGLALCKMVAEAHGGFVYVTENSPKGAVFNVDI